eukprot:7768253-Pyramimonas_sp.AAC.1
MDSPSPPRGGKPRGARGHARSAPRTLAPRPTATFRGGQTDPPRPSRRPSRPPSEDPSNTSTI